MLIIQNEHPKGLVLYIFIFICNGFLYFKKMTSAWAALSIVVLYFGIMF